MTFKTFASAVAQQYNSLAVGELFTVDVEDLFTHYLLAFPDGTDPIYRVRTVHDCNADKNFIRRLGHLVSINADGTRSTIWDHMDHMPYPYNVVAERLRNVVRQAPIVGVFRTKERVFGSEPNWDNHDTSIRWEHFVGRVADRHYAVDPATKRGERDATAQVLRRGLNEISDADLDTVSDLIHANALYRGSEHLAAVVGFKGLKDAFAQSPDHESFIWSNLDNRNARFRNTVIGTLLTDLAEGKDIDQAVRMFEAKVAPANYKRPTAVITPKMIEAAVAKLEELGLGGAVERRYAVIEDINVADVLFVDNAVSGKMVGGLTDLLMSAVKPQTVNVDHATPISIEDFIALDKQTVDVVLTNEQLGNFVSLTAPVRADTGRLFKWGNDFAWSYDGDLADTGLKARVKAAGGKVDAAMRVSLGWFNFDDLDLHVRHSSGEHIYFSSKHGLRTGGRLDVDMNISPNSREAVENVYWPRVVDGNYTVSVHNFTKRENVDVGFNLEFEIGGVLHQYRRDRAVLSKTEPVALTFTIAKGIVTKITAGDGVVGGSTPTTKWGVTTGTLTRVDTIMTSPNYWDGAGAVGNKHWFFMLKDCKNPDATRGIYNEFLRGELDQHRKVFEALGAKTKCPPSDNQLSGVGFSSTRKDEVTVVVNSKRAYKVQF